MPENIHHNDGSFQCSLFTFLLRLVRWV